MQPDLSRLRKGMLAKNLARNVKKMEKTHEEASPGSQQ
jgi:hypothetical protein